MYAITGITGKVGGAAARTLLAGGQAIRAVVRDHAKGAAWAERGCEVAVAEMHDAAALAAAFTGMEGVFLLLPPNFDPAPGLPEIQQIIAALQAALNQAKPPKVVVLSTIGAQATEPNLLTQLHLVEQALWFLSMPVAFVRAGWFMENSGLDVVSARESGIIHSFLDPLDGPKPMVATEDVGRVSAELLQQSWSGVRVVELEGPRRITPNELASTFGKVLGRDVKAVAVPRTDWEGIFRGHGMKNPEPRMRMLDGFNEGWIDYENQKDVLRGEVELETVLRRLVG